MKQELQNNNNNNNNDHNNLNTNSNKSKKKQYKKKSTRKQKWKSNQKEDSVEENLTTKLEGKPSHLYENSSSSISAEKQPNNNNNKNTKSNFNSMFTKIPKTIFLVQNIPEFINSSKFLRFLENECNLAQFDVKCEIGYSKRSKRHLGFGAVVLSAVEDSERSWNDKKIQIQQIMSVIQSTPIDNRNQDLQIICSWPESSKDIERFIKIDTKQSEQPTPKQIKQRKKLRKKIRNMDDIKKTRFVTIDFESLANKPSMDIVIPVEIGMVDVRRPESMFHHLIRPDPIPSSLVHPAKYTMKRIHGLPINGKFYTSKSVQHLDCVTQQKQQIKMNKNNNTHNNNNTHLKNNNSRNNRNNRNESIQLKPYYDYHLLFKFVKNFIYKDERNHPYQRDNHNHNKNTNKRRKLNSTRHTRPVILVAKGPHLENLCLEWISKRANQNFIFPEVFDVDDISAVISETIEKQKKHHHSQNNNNNNRNENSSFNYQRCFFHMQKEERFHCALEDAVTVGIQIQNLLKSIQN